MPVRSVPDAIPDDGGLSDEAFIGALARLGARAARLHDDGQTLEARETVKVLVSTANLWLRLSK